MDLYRYGDHSRAALLRMLEQDRSKAKLQRMLTIHSDRIQALEDAVWTWWENLDLDAAEGEFLDRIGGVVGEAREGRDDELYRLWIRARARANRSPGTSEDMLAILQLILPSEGYAEYADIPDRNAEAYFTIFAPVSSYLEQIKKILESIAPAGVLLHVSGGVDPALAFSFEGGPGLGFNEGQFVGIL